jgi:hypothetical protein
MPPTQAISLGVLSELAVLAKVFVEGEYFPQSKALHHNEAGAIGKREILVGILLGDLPRPGLVSGGDPYVLKERIGQDLLTQLNGQTVIPTEERIDLRKDEIGRQKPAPGLPNLIEVPESLLVVPVIGVPECDEGARINKHELLRLSHFLPR